MFTFDYFHSSSHLTPLCVVLPPAPLPPGPMLSRLPCLLLGTIQIFLFGGGGGAVEPAAYGAAFGNPLSPAVSPVKSPLKSPMKSPAGSPYRGGSPVSPVRTPTSSLSRGLKAFSFQEQASSNSPAYSSSPGERGGMSPGTPHRTGGRQVRRYSCDSY